MNNQEYFRTTKAAKVYLKYENAKWKKFRILCTARLHLWRYSNSQHLYCNKGFLKHLSQYYLIRGTQSVKSPEKNKVRHRGKIIPQPRADRGIRKMLLSKCWAAAAAVLGRGSPGQQQSESKVLLEVKLAQRAEGTKGSPGRTGIKSQRQCGTWPRNAPEVRKRIIT